jgi:hypothetical protein
MIRKTAFTLVFALAGTLGAAAQTDIHVPTPSTWKADLAASDFGGMPAPKSDMMHVTKDTDQMLSWTGTTVDDKGKVWHMGYTGPQDGTLRPVDKQGDKASFKSDGSSHWVMADGSTMESTIAVSDDKSTATITSDMTTKDGKKIHTKEVYNRVGAKKKATT